MTVKVKKGDTVVVIAGKDKGAKGKVIAAFP
ncbi:KOW motif-containing protein, partial [Micromonospora luteifusca]